MKKLTTALSVLLTLALLVASMPVAQAAPAIDLLAEGKVYRSAAAIGAPSVILATVYEGPASAPGMDWDDLAHIRVFPDNTRLQPGSNNDAVPYKFVLFNEYDEAITYDYSQLVLVGNEVPIKYTLMKRAKGEAAFTPAAIPHTGVTVPVDGWVEFELRWKWDRDEDDARDTVVGMNSAASHNATGERTKYQVQLKFYIEAERYVTLYWLDADGSDMGIAPWTRLIPGKSLQYAMDEYGYEWPEDPQKAGFLFKGFTLRGGDSDAYITPDFVIPDGEDELAVELYLEAQWEPDDQDDGCKLPPWVIPLIGGIVIGIGGITIGGLTLPWLAALPLLPLLPLLLVGGALLLRPGNCEHDNCKCGDGCDCDCGSNCDCDCGCDCCGASASVPATTGPVGDGENAGGADEFKPPYTGDNRALPLSAALGLALAGMAALLLRRRKREEACEA